MNSETGAGALDRIASKAGTLYTLPAVALEVLRLTSQPQVDVERLRECIERDPALVSRVLRVVNSALFALRSEVSNLNQAIALLGTKPLKLLVLGFSLPDNLFVGMAGDILRRYWRRTLTKAVAAREISETFFKLPWDEAFLAGLLQDVGMLVLLQEFGESYAQFLDVVFSKGSDVGLLSTRSIGFDHAELTARMLERWSLPRSLVEAVRSGRPPATIADLPTTARCLPQILHLAEMLASLLTENRTDLLSDLLQAAERYHALRPNQLSELVGKLQEKVEQLADVLKLDLPAGTDYTQVMLEAHARLSEVAAEAAGDLLRAGERPTEPYDSEAVLAEVQTIGASVRHAARPREHAVASIVPPAASLRRELWAADHERRAKPAPAAHLPAAPSAESAWSRGSAVPAGEIDPAFLGEISTIASSCRQARSGLSLLLVSIDHFDEVVVARGIDGAERMVKFLGEACQTAAPQGSTCHRTCDNQFALLLAGCDRQDAVEIGQHLLAAMRRFVVPRPGEVRPSVTVSLGIAAVGMPTRSFVPSDLVESAERCLHAARLAGGNALKSIEIY
ncbi:MAG TPA: HDOD domain-containing protein [Pirellulales bacterium]